MEVLLGDAKGEEIAVEGVVGEFEDGDEGDCGAGADLDDVGVGVCGVGLDLIEGVGCWWC